MLCKQVNYLNYLQYLKRAGAKGSLNVETQKTLVRASEHVTESEQNIQYSKTTSIIK
jgi:hypothetical protein